MELNCLHKAVRDTGNGEVAMAAIVAFFTLINTFSMSPVTVAPDHLDSMTLLYDITVLAGMAVLMTVASVLSRKVARLYIATALVILVELILLTNVPLLQNTLPEILASTPLLNVPTTSLSLDPRPAALAAMLPPLAVFYLVWVEAKRCMLNKAQTQ